MTSEWAQNLALFGHWGLFTGRLIPLRHGSLLKNPALTCRNAGRQLIYLTLQICHQQMRASDLIKVVVVVLTRRELATSKRTGELFYFGQLPIDTV